jgi:hypothetical protein
MSEESQGIEGGEQKRTLQGVGECFTLRAGGVERDGERKKRELRTQVRERRQEEGERVRRGGGEDVRERGRGETFLWPRTRLTVKRDGGEKSFQI